MKKVIYVFQLILIALFPIIFLLNVNSIETKVLVLVTRNAEPIYNAWKIVFYTFSGLIFANNIFHKREFYYLKSTIIAYGTSGFLVTLFFISWNLTMFGEIIISSTISRISAFTPINILSLVLGYSLYSTIKAVVLFKKHKKIGE